MKWIWMSLAISLAGGVSVSAQDGSEMPPPPEKAVAEETAAEAPAPEAEQPKETDMVIIKTTLGDITVKLATDKAPLSVANFLAYADAGHYTGTIFHRVIDGFMIQGGGFDPNMRQKPAPATVKNEAANGLQNKRGTLAMARTPDPHSASAQFFINVKDNAFLNYPGQDGWGYCVFGEVVAGMEVVDKIKGVRTGVKAGMPDVPVETVEILSVKRAE